LLLISSETSLWFIFLRDFAPLRAKLLFLLMLSVFRIVQFPIKGKPEKISLKIAVNRRERRDCGEKSKIWSKKTYHRKGERFNILFS